MRRRRFPFRRRPPTRGAPAAANHPRLLLQRAHHMMETGDYLKAGRLFERLAHGALRQGMLRAAPNLFLQSARGYLKAGKTKHGLDLLQRGLRITAKAGKWQILSRVGTRAVDELHQEGLTDAADEIAQWLEDTLPEPRESYLSPGVEEKTPQLPLKCPSCGGPIHPKEVEMLDALTAECPYCGSGIRGE